MTDADRRPTRAEAIARVGDLAAEHEIAMAQMTPREQAEAAWTPGCGRTVNQIEDSIRTTRGLPPRTPTKEECIANAGALLAEAHLANAQMTPREQAEGAWSPTSRKTVDQLEDEIRRDRGLPPIVR